MYTHIIRVYIILVQQPCEVSLGDLLEPLQGKYIYIYIYIYDNNNYNK